MVEVPEALLKDLERYLIEAELKLDRANQRMQKVLKEQRVDKRAMVELNGWNIPQDLKSGWGGVVHIKGFLRQKILPRQSQSTIPAVLDIVHRTKVEPSHFGYKRRMEEEYFGTKVSPTVAEENKGPTLSEYAQMEDVPYIDRADRTNKRFILAVPLLGSANKAAHPRGLIRLVRFATDEEFAAAKSKKDAMLKYLLFGIDHIPSIPELDVIAKQYKLAWNNLFIAPVSIWWIEDDGRIKFGMFNRRFGRWELPKIDYY